MEATEVANKVIDLLTQGAQQVGQTAAEAFPYVVKYKMAQGITGVFCSLVFAFICYRATKKFIDYTQKERTRDAEDIVGIIAVFVAAISFVVAGITFSSSLPDAIAPTGAVIMDIIKHVGGK